MSSYRFHQAARDGFLDVLKEATRRDCNSEDDDGLTPTLWAAFQGNLDALRLIVGRGGDPDKCDHYGNTALHLSAAEGHFNCVTFLANFGVNLWSLDNDFLTAKDRAAMAEREEILRFLDNVMAEQGARNRKLVNGLKEKSVLKAERRVKSSAKQSKEAEKRAKDEEKKLAKQRQRMQQQRRDSGAVAHAPSKYSDIVSAATAGKKSLLGISRKMGRKDESKGEFQMAEEVNDGKRSMRSISGLRRDSEVLYVPKFASAKPQLKNIFENKQELSRARSEPEFLSSAHPPSLFERPGFGSMAFRQSMSGTLMSLPTSFRSDVDVGVRMRANSASDRGSVASADSLEEDDDGGDNEPIITFLASLGLSEFVPVFLDEQIDVDALMLLTEDDLRNVIQPLGPRRKLMRAVEERKEALENPGEVFDSRL